MCPYCNRSIEAYIYGQWVGDYWTYIDDFECPSCHKILEIEVEPIPLFNIKKKGM